MSLAAETLRTELESALAQSDSPDTRYHLRQAMQLLDTLEADVEDPEPRTPR